MYRILALHTPNEDTENEQLGNPSESFKVLEGLHAKQDYEPADKIDDDNANAYRHGASTDGREYLTAEYAVNSTVADH